MLGDYGAESSRHEHRCRIEWTFSARGLGTDGIGVDIAPMEALRARVLSGLDGVYLNDLPFFAKRRASLEKQAPIGEPITAFKVKVWENEMAWASFRHKKAVAP